MFNELLFHNVCLIITKVKTWTNFLPYQIFAFVTSNQQKDIMFSDSD